MKRSKPANELLGMLFIICLYFHFSGAAEASQWVKTYAGSFNSIQQTSDGGFIAAGSISSEGAGGEDFWVVKLNPAGSIVWQKAYGGPGDERASFVAQAPDSGYIVVGSTNSFGAGGSDIWVLKLDGNGGVAWQNTYGGMKADYAYSLQQTSDGRYIVAGITNSFGGDDYLAWVLKLNSDGSLVWQRVYGNSAHYIVTNSVKQASDGGYVLASWDWVLKLNSEGSVLWQKTYAGATLRSIQQTPDGKYVVAGNYEEIHPFAMRLEGEGDIAWQKTYQSVPGSAFSVQLTSEVSYVVSGGYSPPISGVEGASWVLKLNENGDGAWVTSARTLRGAWLMAVQQTSDGGYIAGQAGGLILKLNRSGNVPDCEIITKPSDVIANDTNITSTGISPIEANTNVVPQPSTILPIGTHATEDAVCYFSSSWSGQLSFPVRLTTIVEDASAEKTFHKATESLMGTLKLYFEERSLVTGDDGCYVSFSSEDGTTAMCFKRAAAISTDATRTKTDQILLIGTGDFSMTRDGVLYSGVVYLDARGTLKKHTSGEISSIGLNGKISGGVDDASAFGGHFLITLTK